MSNEQVIERLRKVLTLAKEGATEGEMQAAMTRAKEIAMRYNIDMAQVDLNHPNSKTKSIEAKAESGIKARSMYERPHHKYIFWILEKCFSVRIVRIGVRDHVSQSRRHFQIYLIGDPIDIAISKEMFTWLENLFLREFTKRVKEGRFRRWSAAQENGLYRGLYQGIIDANKKAEENLTYGDAQKWAIVVRSKEQAVEDLLRAMFPNLRAGKSSRRSYDPYAQAEGYEVGSKINLKQVNNGSETTKVKG